jgi:hypothetical protein
MSTTLHHLLRLGAPLAVALATWIISRHFIAPDADVDSITRGLAGPVTWPKAMLYSAAVCAALIFARNLYEILHARSEAPAESAAASGDLGYNDAKLWLGIALLLAYGAGISLIGIAWATLAFMAGWLVLGGFRRRLAVVLVSTLGTLGILYLFVKISAMPLDRGTSVFEEATVSLYRLLGIY